MASTTEILNCIEDIELSIGLITKDRNETCDYSARIPANRLYGYLSYYQFVRNYRNQVEYLDCPDLNESEKLQDFKAFYEIIDIDTFTGLNTEEIDNKKRRHTAMLSLLQRLDKGEESYDTVSTKTFAESYWCSSELMLEYDRFFLGDSDIRILATKTNRGSLNSDQFFLTFYCNLWKNTEKIRLNKEDILRIPQP